MTTIRATCPSCGDVRLKASDVVVRVCANDNKGSYCFRCPSCGLRVTKSADSRIVDLLDFPLMLQDDSWFEQLAERISDVEK